MRTAIFLAVSLAMTGCATAPHRIQPQFVGDAQYRSLDCETIKREIAARDQRLMDLQSRQSSAAGWDAALVTIGTLVFWPAYFGLIATDNHKDEISRLKGENIALLNADAANCS